MAIEVKEAVKKAFEHAKSLLGDEVFSRGNVALEEVDTDSATGNWLVTIGYDSPNRVRKVTYQFHMKSDEEHRTERVYKVFCISAQDGSLINMKIRDIASGCGVVS
jgi:hypothetical protein